VVDSPDDQQSWQANSDWQSSNNAASASHEDDAAIVEGCLELARPALESGIAPDTIISAMFASQPEHIQVALRARLMAASGHKDAEPEAQYRSAESVEPPPAVNAQEDEQTVESCLEMALPALESGIAPDTIINAMFANLPEHIKVMLRQRMGQAIAARDARQHEMHKETVERSRGGVRRLFDMAAIAALISEETLEKIKKLFLNRPDLAQSITREGQRLLNNGVVPEMVRLSETQLGQLSPPAIGQGQGQGRGEGVGF
jgi:DNA-binding TFAR19-related protein (PDSD5 family)